MFIPEWVIWIFGVLLWLAAIVVMGNRQDGPYDFVGAIIAGVIFVAGVSFGAGIILSKLFS